MAPLLSAYRRLAVLDIKKYKQENDVLKKGFGLGSAAIPKQCFVISKKCHLKIVARIK